MFNYNKKFENYNFLNIEEKWQKHWNQYGFCGDYSVKIDKKFYTLEMLPYPSGKIHMGHCRNYTIGDVTARYRRMCGNEVIYPMGWDAFGLPAENAAIEQNSHPKTWTYSNIANMKKTLQRMGFSYDWEREIATCAPEYYKHEQKFFLDMLKSGIAYQKEGVVNWDPVDNTVLSNEQVVNGCGWRSGALVEKKSMKQWYLKITKYAEELLDHQELDWPEQVKLMQKKWIGKSNGSKIIFNISNGEKVEVFTTRVDTIFGASFVALSTDHPLAKEVAKNDLKLQEFIEECKKISKDYSKEPQYLGYKLNLTAKHPILNQVNDVKIEDFDNLDLTDEEMVKLERNIAKISIDKINYEKFINQIGCNPDDILNLPLYVANFVVSDYGAGALFGCPAHDERDFAFAKKYNLPIIEVCDDGFLMKNSLLINELSSDLAKKIITKVLQKNNIGDFSVQCKLHDWGVSRQRYWGCPIPVVHCENCGTVPEKEENLPITLPDDVVIDGSGNPLDRHPTWKFTKCPKCELEATRSTDTFDTFFESSWYFLRYLDAKNENYAFDKNIVNKFMPVDVYIGGIEHAILHLLYARFFVKMLRDFGYLSFNEPFKKLISQGMICHKTYQTISGKWLNPADVFSIDGKLQTEDGIIAIEGSSIKMSKSKKNVVDPTEMIEKYGADTIRMFVLSDSPITKDLEWSQSGIESMYKFINKIWKLCYAISNGQKIIIDDSFNNVNFINKLPSKDRDIIALIHKNIKNILNDYENYSFNTIIARFYDIYNNLSSYISTENFDKKVAEFVMYNFILLLHPFAPHVTMEMKEMCGIEELILPQYSEDCCISNQATIAVQVNGKTKGTIVIDIGSDKDFCIDLAKKEVRAVDAIVVEKVIFVPNKILNFVVNNVIK